MKCKIRKHKSDNTTMVDYSRVKEPREFRYKMQCKLLEENDSTVFLFIDTNTNAGPADKRISAMFDEKGIEYKSFKIKSTERKILGVITNVFKGDKPKMTQQMYIAKINKENYTEEVFMQSLSNYDIALGFNPKHDMEELKEEYREDLYTTFFKDEFYENFVYDSIVFRVFRSTFDVADNAKQIEEAL